MAILLVALWSLSIFADPSDEAGRVKAWVLEVVDGDTLRVLIGEKAERVRLLGVNTPEITMGKHERWGEEARLRLRELVEHQEVELEFQERERDKYKRLLAYVWVKRREKEAAGAVLLVNTDLVRRGYSRVKTYGQPLRYREAFEEQEALARKEGLHLWEGEERLFALPGICSIKARNGQVDAVEMRPGSWMKKENIRRQVWEVLENLLLTGDEGKVAAGLDKIKGVVAEGGKEEK